MQVGFHPTPTRNTFKIGDKDSLIGDLCIGCLPRFEANNFRKIIKIG